MSCFIYYGHFYRLAIDNTTYCCRSTLEIVRSHNQALAREAAQNPGGLLDRRPDAVFVMLNPGGSRPCDGREPINCINPRQIDNHARANLVPTCPDDTQQAVETVMTDKQFDHVRVLNLFDIRERDSAELVRQIRASLGLRRGQRLPNPPEIKPYSIFSCARRCEFRDRLNATSRIVVAAWGTGQAQQFFGPCCEILEGIGLNLQIYGWRAEGRPIEDRRFYHPLRKRREWPRYIIRNWPDEQDAPCQGQGAD